MELSSLVSAAMRAQVLESPDRRQSLPHANTAHHPDSLLSPQLSPTKAGSAMHSSTSSTDPVASLSSTSPRFAPEPAWSAPPPSEPKSLTFELVFRESPQCRARLPLRVKIHRHDDTNSIIETVKNFYGLYSSRTVSKGVSFEDVHGNTLIAGYENFHDQMTVYVRVIEEVTSAPGTFALPTNPSVGGATDYYNNSDGNPAQTNGSSNPRPAPRASRKRSVSPSTGQACRSASASAHPPSRNKPNNAGNLGLESSTITDVSGDGGGGGDPAPRKAKEQLGNTEISLDNIVEGGRRKRAKFESSELPLFAPPQMPAATSNPSVSPARRVDHGSGSYASAHVFPRPMHSPPGFAHGYGFPGGVYGTPSADSRPSRISIGGGPAAGFGVLPTPDPTTVGSCMSEEDKDVAIQLMRLGEMSNISHGRTSASTLDDTFSGIADAASSTGATSDSESGRENEKPVAPRQKPPHPIAAHKSTTILSLPGGDARYCRPVGPWDNAEAVTNDVRMKEGIAMTAAPKARPKTKAAAPPLVSGKPRAPLPDKPPKAKTAKLLASKSKKKATVPASGMMGPVSPASLSRDGSIASTSATLPGMMATGEEEPDLSTKPRCQRCRKSKKGCDRQRPCGRCRDAGIPAELCISEDEGNGRKGRYGRHMGVPIKKDDVPAAPPPTLLPAALISSGSAPAPPMLVDNITTNNNIKNKKKKR